MPDGQAAARNGQSVSQPRADAREAERFKEPEIHRGEDSGGQGLRCRGRRARRVRERAALIWDLIQRTASAFAEADFHLSYCDRQLHAARDILIIEVVTNKYLSAGTFAEKTRLKKRKVLGQVFI